MIQRIQTVYLLLSGLLLLLVVFLPFCEFYTEDNTFYIFKSMGIYQKAETGCQLIDKTIPLLILSALTSALSFITIFFYKKRTLQIRLCMFNILLVLGLCGLLAFYINTALSDLNAFINYSYPLIFPAIAVVLLFMAKRNILKDEKLIRSLDRIR